MHLSVVSSDSPGWAMASAHLLYTLSKGPGEEGSQQVRQAVDSNAAWLTRLALGLLEVRDIKARIPFGWHEHVRMITSRRTSPFSVCHLSHLLSVSFLPHAWPSVMRLHHCPTPHSPTGRCRQQLERRVGVGQQAPVAAGGKTRGSGAGSAGGEGRPEAHDSGG